jgi:hypothetical protein
LITRNSLGYKENHFPLPFIDEMLELLAKHSFFCFLDGYSDNLQIPIHPDDQSKTTFTCPYGTYAYCGSGEGSIDESMDREGIGLDSADEDSSKLDMFFS